MGKWCAYLKTLPRAMARSIGKGSAHWKGWYDSINLADFEDAYEQAESDANTIFSHKFVVEPAVVADKKDKPKRMIVVLMATMGTLIFTIFLLLIKDKISELRKTA